MSTWPTWTEETAATAFDYYLEHVAAGAGPLHIVADILELPGGFIATPPAYCDSHETGQAQISVVALRLWPSLFERPDLEWCRSCFAEFARRGGA
jgi:hypothetical protein